MDWVLWIIAVAVLGVGAVIASGRLGSMGPTVTDTPKPEFPAGPLSSGDLRDVRFAVVPRGYSMDQVDELLDRLAVQLSEGPAALDPSDAVKTTGSAAVAAVAEVAETGGTAATSIPPEPTLPVSPHTVAQV